MTDDALTEPAATAARFAMVGKGGAGKSLIGATLARILARRGHRVLALDSDHVPGLSFSLGADVPAEPPLEQAVEFGPDKRVRWREGMDAILAVERYATDAPDGVRLLQAGKTLPDGRAPWQGAIEAFFAILQSLGHAAFADWSLVGDLPAGPHQVAYDWAPYARRFVLVVQPTWQSMLTARRLKGILVSGKPDVPISLVVNQVTSRARPERVGEFLGLSVEAVVPLDEGAREAEAKGVALLDLAPDGPAARAIEELAARLWADKVS